MKYTYILSFILMSILLQGQQWEIQSTRSIQKIKPRGYSDNIEMAGKKVAGIIHYDIDSLGKLSVKRNIIFPQLRTYINDDAREWQNYRAYLKEEFGDYILPSIFLNKKRVVPGPVQSITIDGTLIFDHEVSNTGIAVQRQFFPSTEQRLFIEQWTLTNTLDSTITVQIGNVFWDQDKYGPYGKYILSVSALSEENVTLAPEESTVFNVDFFAQQENEADLLVREELTDRYFLLDDIHDNLVLKTPNKVLNTLFAFSKVRAAESIFDSKMGMVHSPGGGRYYAGVWANDQAEYSGPFFPYLGLEDGNIAALNAYEKFWQQMQTIPEHDQNLWASHEMNGDLTCCGTDRGDAAMIAYGGLHYLMALGDKTIAEEYEPMIDWCLNYCHKKLNREGVVDSESDEMEGRIPTGTANLSTSSLYYGALDHAIDFYEALKASPDKIKTLRQRKKALAEAIEKYFGSTVEGLDTYKYFKEHKNLRHWICLPLVVGLHDRTEGTVEALFDRLWTDNGVHVEKNSDNPDISKIFWDRGTLYALRGTLIAGKVEQSMQKLIAFSQKRLIGNRVPYVVEAYPEGNMAHLSAESALYVRVFTEGLFGIKPISFDSFSTTPRLPKDWSEMSLEKIQAFGQSFDLTIKRVDKQLEVIVTDDLGKIITQSTIKDGDTLDISLI